MALFTTLYSGSSGNCALILHEGKYLLIDMGKSCRTTLNALRSLGLAVSDCEGILITHEHSDHVSGLDTFFKHYSVPVYGCADTLDTLYSRGTIPPALDAIAMDGRTEDIGTFRVSSFPTSHDVPCCGYRVTTPDGHIMALATDLGVLTPVVQETLPVAAWLRWKPTTTRSACTVGRILIISKCVLPATAATWTTAPVRPSCWT